MKATFLLLSAFALVGCVSALDGAIGTASTVAAEITAQEATLAAACARPEVPQELCDAAWDAYDIAAAEVDALIAALEAAKAAQAAGLEPNMVSVATALERVYAAQRAFVALAKQVTG